MADEILPAGVTDLITSQAMSAEFMMLMADRDGSLLLHPALFYATSPSLTSTVVRVPHLGLGGYDLLGATTPGSEIANTALSDDKTDVTIAVKGKRYTLEQLARVIVNGRLDPVAFAQDAVISITQTAISSSPTSPTTSAPRRAARAWTPPGTTSSTPRRRWRSPR